MDENPSSEDLSDSEFLQKLDQQLNTIENVEETKQKRNLKNGKGRNGGEVRLAEKRKEREDDHSDDGFITVIRRKPKRLIRSDSVDENNDNNGGTLSIHEVCVTSLNNLPKPIAMAKLLRSEDIKDILKIKYKSVNKVLIQFQRKNDAMKLVDCIKLKDIGFRCQLVQDMSTSYGIVKGVDLELSEEELSNIFKANVEVLTVKRLKRLQSDGNWINCESVRVSFKSNVLPQYIYAYECRFKVEPYVFPVTQCSGCWKFGHRNIYCPTKKILCPKCGDNHENCTIKDFKCLNCKGNHFVLDKSCPIFLKEKAIRIIMSEKQVTYRRALQMFMERKEDINTIDTSQCTDNNQPTTTVNSGTKTYRNVLTRAVVHQPAISDMEEDDEKEEEAESFTCMATKENIQSLRQENKKKINRRGLKKSDVSAEKTTRSSQKEKEEPKERSPFLNNFEWTKVWIKIKGIYRSELKLEEKLLSTFKIIWDEFKKFLVSIIFGDNILGFISCLSNG